MRSEPSAFGGGERDGQPVGVECIPAIVAAGAHVTIEDGAGDGDGDRVAGGGPVPCPCQDSHSSNGTPREKGFLYTRGVTSKLVDPSRTDPGSRPEDLAAQNFTPGHRKTAAVIAYEVLRFVQRWGVEHVGFLTLTFADHVTVKKEAAKRFNRLVTGVLRERYEQAIVIWERHKSGRWHVHLLVAIKWADIRTGFDWVAVERGDFRSACAALRKEWAFWGNGRHGAAKAYRFGRTELRPLRTSAEAVAAYVSKYFSKHIDHRHAEDKGARVLAFIGYSKKAKDGTTIRSADRRASMQFAWNSKGAKLWRARVKALGGELGAEDLEGISSVMGPRWAFWLMRVLESEQLEEMRSHENQETAPGAGRAGELEGDSGTDVEQVFNRCSTGRAYRLERHTGRGNAGLSNPQARHGTKAGTPPAGAGIGGSGVRGCGSGARGGFALGPMLARMTAERVAHNARKNELRKATQTVEPQRVTNVPRGTKNCLTSVKRSLYWWNDET